MDTARDEGQTLVVAAMFADRSTEATGEFWDDVVVREMQARDVERCAELLAIRTGRSAVRAVESTTRWIEQSDLIRRMTLVAERNSQVLGYARAAWLDPGSEGGRAPRGWYLTGLVVSADSRRHGVGRRLTEARLTRIADESSEVWYFANERNHVSIHLHERIGFQPHTRDFEIPGVTFEGGSAVLFRLDLSTSV